MTPEFSKRLDALWEKAAHGTHREDLEAAFKLGVEAGGEVTKECGVEAVGTITWPAPDDRRWNSPQPCARVVVEGFRHIITSGQCFRNGTVIVPQLVGMRGTVGMFRASVVWFNLPTLFGGRSHR